MIAVVLIFTSMDMLSEIIHDGDDNLDNGTHHNGAVNADFIEMAPKVTNCATKASFSGKTPHMIDIHNF
eukprot:2636419-Ditylum_brightwellii.AAC.1